MLTSLKECDARSILPFYQRVRIFYLIFAVSVLWATTVGSSPQLVSDLAVKRNIINGAPEYSDVIMRSLAVHPKNYKDPYDTLKALNDFHATRLEWCYSGDKVFISKVKSSGRVFGGAASSRSYYSTEKEQVDRNGLCIKDIEGKPIVAPWKVHWKPVPIWGCMNNPQLINGYVEFLKQYIDSGVQVIQRDEPGGNIRAFPWGGCFCSYCMKGFREYLNKNMAREQLLNFGIDRSAFNYKEHLKKHGIKTRDEYLGSKRDELKKYFEKYQAETTFNFHRRTRKMLDDYARRHVPFSCNSKSFESLENNFDWCFSELGYKDAKPDFILNLLIGSEKQNRRQVLTMPKARIEGVGGENSIKMLTRRVIAMSYACGGHCMVPWDVYMPENDPRYFGTPEQYADLFGFVRANNKFFDAYEYSCSSDPRYEYSRITGQKIGAKPFTIDTPVKIHSDGNVYAITRAVPEKYGKPIVIHLVDWSENPEPFAVSLNAARFFNGRPLNVKLLVPASYNRSDHQTSETTKSYHMLSKSAELEGGYLSMIRVPKIMPWGMLIIEPDKSRFDGVWQPCIWSDKNKFIKDMIEVNMSSDSREATIRYTLDGSVADQFSTRYTSPLKVKKSTRINAISILPDGRSSKNAGVFFQKVREAAVKLLPDREPLNASLLLWLAADSLKNKLADGDPVNTWSAILGTDARVVENCKTPNGKTTQPPRYIERGINNKPAIQFDGIDDSLTIRNYSNQYLINTGFTVFMVTQSSDRNFGICGNGISGTGGSPRLYLQRGSFTYNLLSSNVEMETVKSAPEISVFIHDGVDSIYAGTNGVIAKAVSGIPTVSGFGGGNLSMPFLSGKRNRAGRIAEILIFNRMLTKRERHGVEQYLAEKYNIMVRNKICWKEFR